LKIEYFTYQLKFRHPFTISKGTKTHQPTLVVKLDHMGITGYGEAPAITYYNIPVEKMVEDIEAKKKFIEQFAFTDPERYWHYLHHLFPQNNFLVCALDIAAWDIYGKMRDKKLYELWKGDISRNPLTDFTIGIDTIDKMVAKMKERPWPIYKIKVGTADDIGILKALRQNTTAILRVDANAGWDLETALKLIPELKELGVEFVEQPLAKDNW
jgi:L-alanine-DL-glutamate epimerase-like enolase superfamily enzyme